MFDEVDPKNVVGSIIKGARLMELFSTDRRELSLQEFTAESGYNKTTTYRLLQTLVGVGWLTRSSSGGYRLGWRMLALGGIARADLDLRREAMRFMQQLADDLGDTAFLMVPGQVGAVTIETIVGGNPLQVHGLSAGSVLPYHVAAGPVVLAAFHPELEKLALAAERRTFTEHTTADADAFEKRLAQIRQDGYAVSTEDYIDGVGAVAAPVLGPDGRPLASLSVGGPIDQFRGQRLDVRVEHVVRAASELSSRF